MSKYIPDAEIFAEVNRMLDIWDKKMEELIPEDSFDLQNDRKIEKANKVWNTVQGAIYIDPDGASSDYAEIVEYWTWRTTRYYKDSWRVNWWSPFLVSSNWAQFNLKTKRYLEDNVL